MSLELSQIRERIQSPKYKQEINKAIRHQAKLRFHAETMIDNSLWYSAYNEFLYWVQGILPPDKFKTFVHLLKFPVETNTIVSDIFNEFEQIFSGKNAIFKWEFTSRDYAEDFEDYRDNVLKEQEKWRTEGFQVLKTMINSIVVVDMPSEQTTPPAPYFYFLDIEEVIDVGFTISDDLEYLIFKLDSPDPDKPIVACYDDKSYKVLQLDGSTYNIITENPHQLGYCPAKFFYSKKMSLRDPVTRESEISKVLEKLNWYLFFYTSKKHLDLYAPYPIYSAYREDCDYKDDKGNVCSGGILMNDDGQYVMEGNTIRKCPACSSRNIIGVGSFIEIDAPESAEDADLRDPIQRLDADVNSLKYNTEEVVRLGKEIFLSCAGEVQDQNDQAKNELQIKSKFESRRNILIRVKKNFDIIHKFTTDTICRLRYGNNFIDSVINYGTDWFLKTTKEYYEIYNEAKRTGATETELEEITETRLGVEFRDNKNKLDRIQILRDLEPYPHKNIKELTELIRYYPEGINLNQFVIKLNFSNFIARFESENTNILEFGSNIQYSEKLKIIKKQLNNYADELRS